MLAPVAAPIAPPPMTPQGGNGAMPIPFRRSTIERANQLPPESGFSMAAPQIFDRTVEGNGFVYGLTLRVTITSTGNAATVVLAEDAPWSFFDSVIFRDVNGELVNAGGYSLYVANLLNRQYAVRNVDQSTRAYLQTALLAGAGATAGSGTFVIHVPIAINRRDLSGLLGNQDRAQKYNLRLSTSALATLFSTPPNGTVTATIEKQYENYSVPMPQASNGQPQMYLPPDFGTMRFTTRTLSESVPLGGSTQTHQLRRLGNTMRWLALVFRLNNSRASAEVAANLVTQIQMKIGDDTIFSEPWWYRKYLMYQRYGFDLPDGVLVYDMIHDFGAAAGNELGSDYYHTQGLANAQFNISYPATWGSTANSLEFITDDIQRVGASLQGG
jgi:hypothetical protein